MRYIDNRQIRLPEGWVEEARNALALVRSGQKNVNDLGDIWRKLKDPLADLSNDKCWYCECHQERSDDAVDHFRPKNRVSGCQNPHSGYWWLAFEVNNYRYSCTYCNSRRKNCETGDTQGKGDFFPLIDEGSRGYQENQERYESPALIDPCRPLEPGWIDFYADGTPCAKYPQVELRRKKAEASIYYYHLNHPDIIEARRRIAVDIGSWIDEGDELYEQLDESTDAVQKAFSGIMRNIITAMNEGSPYSAFVRRIVRDHRDKAWIDDLFQIL
ncbi:hypothetical protein [Nodosilinea sp. P-1105]|uniref:hypothetical protein n=1 Tax=Nodosilinea sp. P-1105 TaxID=2546229 RepID=UPI00146EBB67|nr:hypothetical protein [Nodosilinea sp. P-1105]NMF86632.1 hypothetical protein [Nodosilinea sp. P-1105]